MQRWGSCIVSREKSGESDQIDTPPVTGPSTATPVHQLYRKQAVSGQNDGLGGVVLVNPPGLRIYGGLILLSLIVATTAMTTISLSQKVVTDGQLVPVGGEVQIEAPIAGTLSALPTTLGREVVVGAPVAVILSDLTTHTGEALAPVLLSSLAAQKGELTRRRSGTEIAYRADADELEARLAGLGEEIASNRRQRELLIRRREMAASQVEQMKSLVENGYGAAIELSRREEALLLASQELESADARVRAGQAQASELKARLRSLSARQSNDLAGLDQEIADINMRTASTVAEGGRTVRSPVAGRVVTMPARVGQRVSQGTPLLSVIQADDRLEVELAASPQTVYNFTPGLRVHVQVDAYPYQRHGVLEGTVIAVTGSTLPTTTMSIEATPAYSVRVRLDRNLKALAQHGFDLRPGMSVKGVAISRTRPLWQFVFGPLIGLRDDGKTEMDA